MRCGDEAEPVPRSTLRPDRAAGKSLIAGRCRRPACATQRSKIAGDEHLTTLFFLVVYVIPQVLPGLYDTLSVERIPIVFRK